MSNNIPPYILCETPSLARQVLEKIEPFIEKMPNHYHSHGSHFTAHYSLRQMYPLLINTNEGDYLSFVEQDSSGITNFTKAEEYLLRKEWPAVTTFEELDNQLDKLINSDMTNKTWDNLEENDILIAPNSDRIEVLGVIGRIVFTTIDGLDDSDCTQWTKRLLIDRGYKIKGASEEKPSLDDVIKILSSCEGDDAYTIEYLPKAIEMLKKIKS